jgi:glycosyltransferase involved in cell wall biosynthesis
VLDQVKIGQLVAPKDPGALANAIIRYLQDPHLAQVAGDQAHNIAAERYSVTRMVTEVEAVYREVATREGASSAP